MTEPAAAAPASFIPQWTFGDRLRKIRRHAGIGQTEFAETLGTNQKTYASWETDKSAPRDVVAVAKRIELYTGVPAAWTLSINTPPDGSPQESITARFPLASSSAGGATAQVIALAHRRSAVAAGNASPTPSGAQEAAAVPRSVAGRVEHHVPAA